MQQKKNSFHLKEHTSIPAHKLPLNKSLAQIKKKKSQILTLLKAKD